MGATRNLYFSMSSDKRSSDLDKHGDACLLVKLPNCVCVNINFIRLGSGHKGVCAHPGE